MRYTSRCRSIRYEEENLEGKSLKLEKLKTFFIEKSTVINFSMNRNINKDIMLFFVVFENSFEIEISIEILLA